MAQIFEVVMLICFGLSWPISVYKSIKTKSAKGKSVTFLFAIIIGYISGIIGKIISGNFSYVLILYLVNLLVVTLDLILFFINKRNEKKHFEDKDNSYMASGSLEGNELIKTSCKNK